MKPVIRFLFISCFFLLISHEKLSAYHNSTMLSNTILSEAEEGAKADITKVDVEKVVLNITLPSDKIRQCTKKEFMCYENKEENEENNETAAFKKYIKSIATFHCIVLSLSQSKGYAIRQDYTIQSLFTDSSKYILYHIIRI